MLWYTKKQHKTILLVGNLEKGMYWQASDETHQPDAHASKGASACSGAMKRGASCLYRKADIFFAVSRGPNLPNQEKKNQYINTPSLTGL